MKNNLARTCVSLTIFIVTLSFLFINLNHAINPSEALEIQASKKYIVKEMTTLEFNSTDFIFDQNKELIYVATSDSEAENPHNIIVLDASNFEVQSTIPITAQPTKLAISEDGSMLYVALWEIGSIQRVNLISQTADITFSISDFPETPIRAGEMVVDPRDPKSVIVSAVEGFGNRGIFVYKDGVKQPASIPESVYLETIKPSGVPNKVYGHSYNPSSRSILREFELTNDGIIEIAATDISSLNLDFVWAKLYEGLFYDPQGNIFDPVSKSIVASYVYSETGYMAGPFSINSQFETAVFFTTPFSDDTDQSTYIGLFDQSNLTHISDIRLDPVINPIDTRKIELINQTQLLLRVSTNNSFDFYDPDNSDLYLIEIEELDQFTYLPAARNNFP